MRWTPDGKQGPALLLPQGRRCKAKVMVRGTMRRENLAWHDSGVVRSDPSRRGGWGAVEPLPIRQPWVGIGRFLVDFGTFCHHVQLSRARLRPFPPIYMPTRALTAAEFISCSSLSWPFLAHPRQPIWVRNQAGRASQAGPHRAWCVGPSWMARCPSCRRPQGCFPWPPSPSLTLKSPRARQFAMC